jgi:cytochrome c oxidase subunit 2
VIELFRRLFFLPDGASSIAYGIDALHAFVIGVTAVVSLYVFAVATWFTIRYRQRQKGQLTEKLAATRLHEGFVIGSVTFTFLLWWVIGFRQYTEMASPPANAPVIYVDAKQWMWKFAYADGRAENDTLTVPVDEPVKLVMTSRDVIHSFYVPAFRLKQDVIPGRSTTMWFKPTKTGTYPIWCAEYCGVSHSLMRGQIVVLSREDYAKWRAGTDDNADWVARGREVATKRACVACHTFDGQRHVGPTWRGLYGSERALADGRRIMADDAYLTRSMNEPNADVVAGYSSAMPSYQGILSAAETGALVAFIQSLKDAPGSAPGVALPPVEVRP